MSVSRTLCAGALAALALQSAPATAQLVEPAQPLGGWNILQQEYVDARLLDGFSLEWDYFMIHDADEDFTGIIGLVLADPRGRLGDPQPNEIIQFDLMPSGGNVAVAGQFADGQRISNFKDFGIAATTASATERTFEASGGGEFATMAPTEDGGLHLVGQSADVAYDLVVHQDWVDRPAFEPRTAHDVATIPGEFWTVNMLWPRTRVTGTITRLTDNTTYDIDGHGYRENSWGRWAFVLGGWDFGIVSDDSTGVQWAWQSYHKGETLDMLDVSFYDQGELQSIRFERSEGDLGWKHDSWRWERKARQCMPRNTRLVADNGDYRVEAYIDIGNDQIPLLSNATIVTSVYVIQEWFPVITGTITNLNTGEVVTSFAGRAGGEISYLKSALPWRSTLGCTLWGRTLYRAPMP